MSVKVSVTHLVDVVTFGGCGCGSGRVDGYSNRWWCWRLWLITVAGFSGDYRCINNEG